MKLSYTIPEVSPYINWAYFFYAWGMHGKPEAEQQRLRTEAEQLLVTLGDSYRTYGLFRLFEANSKGDDILVGRSETGENPATAVTTVRIPLLRQQEAGSEYLCLADFVRPLTMGETDRMGVFATTVDHGLETDFDDDPYQKMMVQLLADRLAEATAERMHEEIRKTYWGYAPDEALTIGEMQQERWQGIRPAVGYPSLPDTSLNFVIDQLLGLKQIGIRLTESGAMKPHASVSGLMISHPQARYFSVGKIGDDQLYDYALRRGLPVEAVRKFLAGNL
ncbi:MAG: 5-methyltetrahydrofolate--homocysteine methyltransferase [Prevotella sp.]|nr:5-methyltetrahydrofolate--homocysteine methyltransferase [Prevotella sp.]